MEPTTILSILASIAIVVLGGMWRTLSQGQVRIEGRLEKLDEKLTDVDRRLCRLEGAFTHAQSFEPRILERK